MFEELRCENFYEKGLVEQRGKADDEYAITTPKLNASTSSTSGSETTKRRSGERSGHGHPPTKQQRLSSVDDDTPLAAVKKSATNTPANRYAYPPQPRPRGRPVGSKNKNTDAKRTAAPAGTPHQTPPSPSKKLPIYHNAAATAAATKVFHQRAQHAPQSSRQLQPPTLKPQVPSSNVRCVPPTTASSYYSREEDQLPHHSNALKAVALGTLGPAHPFHKSNLPDDFNEWTIEQVIGHISLMDPSLEPWVEMFKEHEIDGKALSLLSSDQMMKYMQMKLGPALKISNIVDMIQGKKYTKLAIECD